MSYWSRAQQLPAESMTKIQAIYGEHFPIEVRHYLATWIEQKTCMPIEAEGCQMFVEELIMELNRTAELLVSPEMFTTRYRLQDAARMFRDKFSHNPLELFKLVNQCVAREVEVINEAFSGQVAMQPERKYGELIKGFEQLRQSTAAANAELRAIDSKIESFTLEYHRCTKLKATEQCFLTNRNPADQQRREMELQIREQVSHLEHTLNSMLNEVIMGYQTVADRLKSNITILQELQSQVLDVELIRWKREQQLQGNGAPVQSDLNTIQGWCETLAELIWQTRQQVKEAERLSNKMKDYIKAPLDDTGALPNLGKDVTSLLSTLVTSTFIIEKQPPQVMKTNTRFTATVRLLVGGQLNVNMTPPQVKVIIISEQQAQTLLKSESRNRQPTEMCGEIINNTGCMEYQPSNKQLSVSFRNMQLRKIKRAEKKGTESVMDEKLTLLFQSQFNVGGGELVFQVWTLSLPVVVIVHGNQEPHGWATVTWDNAFSAPGRVPFAVPDKVTWGLMAETLNLKFNAATGSPLSEDNLRFLAEKMFSVTRSPIPVSTSELNNTMVSWSQFCKEPLPDKNFTFWEWFYQVIKVTREHLRSLWSDRLIMGFIQKNRAEELLAQCPPGTFLLRFSDSELGGITVAFVGYTKQEQQTGADWLHSARDGITEYPTVVYSLQPFTARDLVLRSLADRIRDLNELTVLYQGRLKEEAFSKYFAAPEKEPVKNGYVKPVLVTQMPWCHSRSVCGGGTPQHAASPPYLHNSDSRDTPSVHSSYAATATPHSAVQMFMENDLYDQMNSFDPDDFESPMDINSFVLPNSTLAPFK